MGQTFNPRTHFSEFYGNSAVNALAGASRWTVSGRLGDGEASRGKAPIDVRHLFGTGCVRGAWSRDKQCLVTLDELTRLLPGAANCAYYLQSSTDGVVVLDIEPDCPPEVSAALLAIPGALYSEVSMSGRGYHLVFANPTNAQNFPHAIGKAVLREEHGWYEILLDHWVTFTRRPIPRNLFDRPSRTMRFASIEEVYADLAVSARVSSHPVEMSIDEAVPKIAGGKRIVQQMVNGASPRFKTPEDFHGDLSRWEFSTLGVLYVEMQRALISNHSFTDQVWLLYVAAKKVLPHRAKHDERRNGQPFLFDRAASMVALNLPPDNDKEN